MMATLFSTCIVYVNVGVFLLLLFLMLLLLLMSEDVND